MEAWQGAAFYLRLLFSQSATVYLEIMVTGLEIFSKLHNFIIMFFQVPGLEQNPEGISKPETTNFLSSLGHILDSQLVSSSGERHNSAWRRWGLCRLPVHQRREFPLDNFPSEQLLSSVSGDQAEAD